MSKRKNIVKRLYQHQKRWFAKWHTAAGIIAGAVLILVSLTGSILVYEQEIDTLLNPELFDFKEKGKQPILGFQEAYNRTKPQLGKDHTHIFYRDAQRNDAYLGYLEHSKRQVIVNPYTGKVTGTRVYASTFTGFVRSFHRTLLIPVIGRYLVGISALMCLVLMVSGLRLWVPKKIKYLRSRLVIRTKAKKRRVNYDTHNVLGFYFSPFMSIISLTGAAITFGQFIALGLFLVSLSPPKSIQQLLGSKSTYVANKKTMTIEELQQKVKKLRPNGVIQGIQVPHDSVDVITADIMEPVSFNHVGHRSRMSFDQYSGKLLFDTDRDVPETGRLYLDWLTPLHYGTFGGPVTRVIALITCLVMATLFITGLYIWIPRWKNKKRAQSQKTAQNAPKTKKTKRPAILATSGEDSNTEQ